MAPQKKAQPGWNSRNVDADKALRDEIDAAELTAVRPNLRLRMATLQDVPMATASISFDGSLEDWIDRCLSEAEGARPVTSSTLIIRDKTVPDPSQSNTKLSPEVDAPSKNFSTSDDFVLLRALAARIDEWDTDGLFKAEGSKGLLWLILGLSQDRRYASGAEKMYDLASGTSFHRIATVFWVHMVFDMLAYQGELQFGAPRTVVPNLNQLGFLRKKEGVKSLFLWLIKWPKNLNKLFAEPPKPPAPDTFDVPPSSSSPPVVSRSPQPLHTPLSATAQPSSTPHPFDGSSQHCNVATLYTAPSSRFVLEAAAHTNTSVLLRRMPLDVAASAAVQSVIFEDVSKRDRDMRHPHVINNLAMAGAVFSYLVTSDIDCKSGLDFKASLAASHFTHTHSILEDRSSDEILQPFLLALHVSPLLLLSGVSSSSHNRTSWMNMFALRIALGNTGRPSVVTLMEQEIWRGVMKISIGVRPEVVLYDLYATWQQYRGTVTDDDSEWFETLNMSEASVSEVLSTPSSPSSPELPLDQMPSTSAAIPGEPDSSLDDPTPAPAQVHDVETEVLKHLEEVIVREGVPKTPREFVDYFKRTWTEVRTTSALRSQTPQVKCELDNELGSSSAAQELHPSGAPAGGLSEECDVLFAPMPDQDSISLSSSALPMSTITSSTTTSLHPSPHATPPPSSPSVASSPHHSTDLPSATFSSTSSSAPCSTPLVRPIPPTSVARPLVQYDISPWSPPSSTTVLLSSSRGADALRSPGTPTPGAQLIEKDNRPPDHQSALRQEMKVAADDSQALFAASSESFVPVLPALELDAVPGGFSEDQTSTGEYKLDACFGDGLREGTGQIDVSVHHDDTQTTAALVEAASPAPSTEQGPGEPTRPEKERHVIAAAAVEHRDDSDPPARVVMETAAVTQQTSTKAIDVAPSEPGRKPSIPPKLHNVRQQVRKDYRVGPPPPVRRKANARPSQKSKSTNKRTRELLLDNTADNVTAGTAPLDEQAPDKRPRDETVMEFDSPEEGIDGDLLLGHRSVKYHRFEVRSGKRTTVEFTPHPNVWDTEAHIFKDLWSQMTDPDGGTIVDWEGNGEAKPLHFHPNASKVVFSPDDPYTSSIFRVSLEDFRKMSPQAIRAVFRNRHILVYDVPHEEKWSWSPESFEQICPLDAMVECQDMSMRDMDDETIQTNTWHTWAFVLHTAPCSSSNDSWELISEIEPSPSAPDRSHNWDVNGAMVNVLDLPRQRDELERIPRWRAIASDVTAMEALDYRTISTRDADHHAYEHTSWAIASTPGAVSRVHVDTGGLCTVSMPLTGEKYWAVATPRKDYVDPDGRSVERGSVDCYKGFNAGYIDPRYKWEAVSINSGTVFYMRPNTLHYVFTQEPSIVYGRHFYCSSVVFDCAIGAVYAFLADQSITNTSHPDLLPFLSNLNSWFTAIEFEKAIRPSLSDSADSKARTALCCMAIFWRALDWRTYKMTKRNVKGTDTQRNDPEDRKAWKTDFAFSESHKRVSLLARRGAAAYILYKAREGFASSTRSRSDNYAPDYQPLGEGTTLDALAWLPERFRLQFAQIIHFALAMFTCRLSLDDVPSPIRIDRFRYWLVKDFTAFAGKTLGDHLGKWLDEVKERFEEGEKVVANFELPLTHFEYVSSLCSDLRFKDSDFSFGQKALFFYVADVFDSYDGEYDVGAEDPGAARF